MTNDNLFDSIDQMLKGPSETGEQRGVSPELGDLIKDTALSSHPYLKVNDDGVPVIIDLCFGTFFEMGQINALRDEARKAMIDLGVMMNMNSESTWEEKSSALTTFMQGNYDRTDELANTRWLARFVMHAALVTIVSISKSNDANEDGVFVSDDSYRMGFMASDILKVARTIASPIRTDYAVRTGLIGGDE